MKSYHFSAAFGAVMNVLNIDDDDSFHLDDFGWASVSLSNDTFCVNNIVIDIFCSLRQSWSDALNDALTTFRNLLTSGQSTSWKRVPVATRENSGSGDKAKARALVKPEGKNVSLHRRSTKSGDVYRVILDVPADEEVVDLDAWKAVLVTPELRQEWDPAVESSNSLEMLDPSTRIVKTKFTLGWPAK